MHRILKDLLILGTQTIKLPADAQIMHVGVQNRNIAMWYEVNTDSEGIPVHRMEQRTLIVYGTGHLIAFSRKERQYLGTVMIDSYVWHVFELVGVPR